MRWVGNTVLRHDLADPPVCEMIDILRDSCEKTALFPGRYLNSPRLCGQHKKAPWKENIKFQAEWRSVIGATPVLSWIRWWL